MFKNLLKRRSSSEYPLWDFRNMLIRFDVRQLMSKELKEQSDQGLSLR